MVRQEVLEPEIGARMEKAATLSEHFIVLLKCTAVVLPPKGILAGPACMNYGQAVETLQTSYGIRPGSEDNLHFAMNVKTLLGLGLVGIEKKARENAARLSGGESDYLKAIVRCYHAVISYVSRHAEQAEYEAGLAPGEEQLRLKKISRNCRALCERPPQTFAEAVQLFWFAWVIRGHGTVGRLDQHLYPFYEADIEAGRTTRDEAFTILKELWEGFNKAGSGDTLVNLMLAGQDRQGNDATNDISYLMIDAALAVRMTEPHLAARFHNKTPEEFWDKVAQLQLLGHGQGTFYNDEALVPSLVKLGVPLESARNYANDGCTELTIDGESGIVFVVTEDLKSLELTLFNGQENVLPGEPMGQYTTRTETPRRLKTGLQLGYQTGDFTKMTSYEQVYEAFLKQYFYHLDRTLKGLCEDIRRAQREGVSSPFLAGTFPVCLDTGKDLLRGGFTVDCYVIYAGSIPTVADCLAGIKKVVFENQACTPTELLDALRANFEGYEWLRRRCLAAPKFGNDDDYVDEIASDIARRFCEHVVNYPTPTGKPFWPALYNHLFSDFSKIVGATPDGRRWKDLIAEHYSPTPGRAKKGPTAVIRSAAKGPLAEACGSSIFHVSMTRSMVPFNEKGRALVRQITTTAKNLGVAVMNVAIYDVDALKDAKVHPEKYDDLIVRVWGFSARFVNLPNDMQDHIINRAVGGEI